jgi:hypothetical protein
MALDPATLVGDQLIYLPNMRFEGVTRAAAFWIKQRIQVVRMNAIDAAAFYKVEKTGLERSQTDAETDLG